MRASENPRRRLGRRGHGTNRKPSSVSALARGDGHLSGMAVAGHLEQPTRGSPLPVWAVWVTPRRLFGLAPTGGCSAARCYQERGGLLPHPFTLTLRSLALPQGGLLSVALSVASRRPGVTWQSTRWSSDFPRRSLRLPATNPFIPCCNITGVEQAIGNGQWALGKRLHCPLPTACCLNSDPRPLLEASPAPPGPAAQRRAAARRRPARWPPPA